MSVYIFIELANDCYCVPMIVPIYCSFTFCSSEHLPPPTFTPKLQKQTNKRLLLNSKNHSLSLPLHNTMAFYIEHRFRAPGTSATKVSPFEAAVEELLNGLLCHYEPPTNKRLMSRPEIELQDQLALRRPSSILKTSSSFDGSKKRKKGRFVRFTGISLKSNHSNKNNGHRSGSGFLKKLTRRKASF